MSSKPKKILTLKIRFIETDKPTEWGVQHPANKKLKKIDSNTPISEL